MSSIINHSSTMYSFYILMALYLQIVFLLKKKHSTGILKLLPKSFSPSQELGASFPSNFFACWSVEDEESAGS